MQLPYHTGFFFSHQNSWVTTLLCSKKQFNTILKVSNVKKKTTCGNSCLQHLKHVCFITSRHFIDMSSFSYTILCILKDIVGKKYSSWESD